MTSLWQVEIIVRQTDKTNKNGVVVQHVFTSHDSNGNHRYFDSPNDAFESALYKALDKNFVSEAKVCWALLTYDRDGRVEEWRGKLITQQTKQKDKST